MVKSTQKELAVILRKQGYSYNLILKKVPVSKSTLTLWLADVPYTPNSEVMNRIRGATLNVRKWQNAQKRDSLERATASAKQQLGNVTPRDLLMLGIGLYIGEGSKSEDIVRVINADPQVICLALRWFEESLGLNKKHFSIRIHLYPDNDIEEAITFWSTVTGLPKDQFSKVQIDRRNKTFKKRGMLKYGTAHLSVMARGKPECGSFLSRRILALIDETYRQIS